jgi:hypothetical protein
MVFADDLNVFCLEIPGAQQLVDASTDYFLEKRLTPNPEKCEFIAFSRRRLPPQQLCTVQGVQREWQTTARYLGVIFESNGKWVRQQQVALARSRIALGRCKVMIGTVGRSRVKIGLELFESTVSSVYRFGLGVWGVLARKIGQLDDLFVDLVRWLFRLPRTTGKYVILANFGRRCAKCDALFLAAVQLASAQTSNNETWADAARDLREGNLRSAWYAAVISELSKRGFTDEVIRWGAQFLSERKRRAVEFSQYCFHRHLQVPTGTSADELRRLRPFGVFPFLLHSNPA